MPNVLFGRLALECAPGALSTLADRLTVLLPWGTLLRTVARPEPNGLARLANICREGAELRIVFGYGGTTDPKASEMDLPSLEETTALDHLELTYGGGGFSVVARHLSVADVATLPTTWAKKLAYSGKRRVFVEILGHCLRPTAWR